jgi:hypothetical protein
MWARDLPGAHRDTEQARTQLELFPDILIKNTCLRYTRIGGAEVPMVRKASASRSETGQICDGPIGLTFACRNTKFSIDVPKIVYYTNV